LVDELMEEAKVCPTCGHVHDHDHEHHHEGECCHHHDHEHHHEDECCHHHDHEHHHEGECCHHDHEHHHEDECCHYDHEHHHEDECCHHHEHHHEDECCHHHDHDHHHHDGECGCGHEHHHHHADDVFTSWGVETPHKYNKSDMEAILKALADMDNPEYGIILRAKGMVPDTEGGWIYFDLTPGEYELRSGQPDVTGKLCVIGSELKEDRIVELFQL